jgi:hypothetical protein
VKANPGKGRATPVISDEARKRMLAGLKPVAKGEVRNPKGINQYSSTYRLDFEKSIDLMLKGPLTEKLRERIPEELRELVEAHPEMTAGQAIALAQVVRSLEGDERAITATLERLWPKTERHELTGADGGAVEVAGESPWDVLAGRVDRVEARAVDIQRDREPAESGEEETLQ